MEEGAMQRAILMDRSNRVARGEDIKIDDWYELFIGRSLTPFYVDFTKQETRQRKDYTTKKEIPCFDIRSMVEAEKTKNQSLIDMREKWQCLFYYNQGVLLFTHCGFSNNPFYNHIDFPIKGNLLRGLVNALKAQGITFTNTGSELEVSDKMFCKYGTYQVKEHMTWEEAYLIMGYDDKEYREALPIPFYSRTDGNVCGKVDTVKGQQGLTGLKNEYPDLDTHKFLSTIIETVING
jgi:hypothetical protein